MVRRLFLPAIVATLSLGCSLLSDYSGISDGRADADGGADGAVDAEAALCATALFCESFDKGSLVPPWTEAFTEGSDLRLDEKRSDAPSTPQGRGLFSCRPAS